MDRQPAQRAKVSSDAPPVRATEGVSHGKSQIPRAGEVLAWVFAIFCALIAIGSPRSILDDREVSCLWPHHLRDLLAWLDWIVQLRWTLGALVIAPFVISVITVSRMKEESRKYFEGLTLVPCEPPTSSDIPRSHVEMVDKALWEKRERAIQISWNYEKTRVLRSQQRLYLQALIFGDVATFIFMCSALVLSWHDQKIIGDLAYSVTAAAATAFLLNLARVLLRISGSDATTRTFAWATRSLVRVIIANIGLHVLLQNEITNVAGALLLGVFVGATGGAAIQLLVDRGTKIVGAKTQKTEVAQTRSQLLDIEGMTPEHVERLEEEGILSAHDLAFAPTARLFFATAYSLQQICNWQDRALLLVYVGKQSADALGEKMEIRGALDLRTFAHSALFGAGSEASQINESLRKTLNLDPGGLTALLRSMAHDEVTMRLRYYWGSTVASKPQGEAFHESGEVAGVTAGRDTGEHARGEHRSVAPAQVPVTSLTLDVTPDGFVAQEITVIDMWSDRA